LRDEWRAKARAVPEWCILSRAILGRGAPAIVQARARIGRVIPPAISPEILCFIGLLDTQCRRSNSRNACAGNDCKPA
jgi:hypothetical protein